MEAKVYERWKIRRVDAGGHSDSPRENHQDDTGRRQGDANGRHQSSSLEQGMFVIHQTKVKSSGGHVRNSKLGGKTAIESSLRKGLRPERASGSIIINRRKV